MKFIVTVDTEADDQWNQTQESVGLRNLEALPRFQESMESFGFVPTYLTSYEVWENKDAAQFLVQKHKAGKAEVGGHLHPWTTPPRTAFDDTVQRFPLELSDVELDDKLRVLTEKITEHIGETPVSFRAGRWGFDDRVAAAVVKRGYKVDSSITPGINWGTIVRDRAQHTHLPDFTEELVKPVRRAGILEVPMTIVPTGLVHYAPVVRMAHKKTVIGKVARALARPTWCRIFPETTTADLVRVHRRAQHLGLPALVFMIHSSELMAGMSPYTKTEAAVDHVYEVLHSFGTYLNEQGIEAVRMRDLLETL